MRKLVLNVTLSALGALLIGSIAAWATNTTIAVTAGSGTIANLISFASTHVISEVGICDATTENQCGAVKAGNTAATTDVAAVVSDPNLLAAVQATGTVQGGAANGVATAGNPVQAGCVAQSAEAAVLAGQAASVVCDLARKVIVLPYANPENFVSGVTAAMTGTTSTSILGAPAASVRNYLTHLICTNSHATVGTFVLVQDGSGGTTIYEGYAAAVGGGFSISFPTPLRQPTAATAMFVQDVTTGANVICSASGYKGA